MSEAPVFLTLDEVLALHARSIELHGGSLGIRDVGLLESALAMPRAGFAGEDLHPSLAEKAAAYLYHIVRNHPFVDGNKRTGLAVALVFLETNGVRVHAPGDDLVNLVLGVAEGTCTKADVSVLLAVHSRSID